VLLEALASAHYPIRWTAAVALRQVGSAGASAALLERILNGTTEQREAAAVAAFGPLARTSEPALLRDVERALAASSGPVRDALIEALGNAPGVAGAAPLLRALAGAGRATRAKIAEVLALHPEAAPEVVRLTLDPDPPVRANAAWTIGQIGSSEHLPALVALIEDRSAPVAATAVAAIGLLGSRQAPAPARVLCRLLDDDRGYVRANTLAALRLTHQACGDSAAVRWALLHDPVEEVRIAAAEFLRARRGEGANADALARCARRDASGQVALACAAPRAASLAKPSSAKTTAVSVLVASGSESGTNPRVPFALVRADGLLRAGWADRRGSALEAHAPTGTLRLALPAPFGE
jgi:HEAT repeat protein